jgi:hypothetical protein
MRDAAGVYLWHVEVIHKHHHGVASRRAVHTPAPLLQLAINDVLKVSKK